MSKRHKDGDKEERRDARSKQEKVQHKDGKVFSPPPRLHQKCCTVWHIAQVWKTQSAACADSLAQCEALCCGLVKLSILVERVATKQPGSEQLQLSWFSCSPPARPHAGAPSAHRRGGGRCDLRSKGGTFRCDFAAVITHAVWGQNLLPG